MTSQLHVTGLAADYDFFDLRSAHDADVKLLSVLRSEFTGLALASIRSQNDFLSVAGRELAVLAFENDLFLDNFSVATVGFAPAVRGCDVITASQTPCSSAITSRGSTIFLLLME